MANYSRLARFALLVFLLVACSSPSVPPTPTAPAPTETPTATVPAATPTETATVESTTSPAMPCEIVAEREVTVYSRPSSSANVFGSMAAGDRVMAGGRTADGWLGFDPGVAQAANMGIFRLRWVDGSSGVRLEGTCDDLPELVGPPPGVCFTMPMDEVHVYAEPDVSSAVVATMTPGDYAAVKGQTADGWAKVDLSAGNTGLDLSGWIEGTTLNFNGPCENLPTIEP